MAGYFQIFTVVLIFTLVFFNAILKDNFYIFFPGGIIIQSLP